jgi:hypothetical protein
MKTNNAWKKRFVAGAAFLACVGAALTLEASVTISSLTPATGAEVTNGVSMTVTALLTTNNGSVVQSVELAYAWNGGDWNTQAMTAVSGTNYTATILPAVSSLAFYVTCRTGTTGVAISTTNAVSTTLPDYVRYADFDVTNAVAMDYAWMQTPGTTNWVYTIGTNSWTANQCRMPIPSVANCPPGGTNRVIQLLSKQGGASYVQTPILAEGVGTIYYTSVMSDAGFSAQMIIQVTTNSSPGNWQDIWTNNYNNYPGLPDRYAKTTNAIPVVLNNRAVRYVRFWRTDNGKTTSGGLPNLPTQGSIYLDNIAISRPPTDVTITQLLQNPGYPSQDQDVRVRCQVNDVDAAIPSVNRRVTVTNNWGGQINLDSKGGGLYEGVIPRHSVGTNVYSFACAFDGYAYSRDPDGSAGAQTNRNERIGRSQSRSFEYGVRPFLSDVQVMQVVTNPAGAAVNMDLVGDHVWQWAWTNAASSTLNWTFAGLAGYTNNATVYDPTSWKWGDTNQAAPYTIPINGFAERDATNAIAATGISSNLMIQMNRQTGEYIATADRLALWNIAPVPGSPVAIGRAFTVGADITRLVTGGVEIVSVELIYSWGGVDYITQMRETTANRYEGEVPRLPVGALTNYVRATYIIDGVTKTIMSQPISYTLTDALDASRFTDFRAGTWTPENATQTNYTYQVGALTSTWWVAEMGKYPVTNGATLPPGSVSPAFGIRAQTNAFLQSPSLSNGVGTVYFTSVMGETNRGGQVAVQYTTDNVPGNWQTATTLVYAASSGYRATNSAPVTINNAAVRYVRFVRQDSIAGLDVGLIHFDNIYLSPPPTQVTITESLYNPGYPASNQAVTVRCRVADVDAGNPSTNRLVHLHYRWNTNSGSWTTNNMVLTNGVYEWTIPQLGAGTNYYYFSCDYEGYFYSHDPDGAGPQPSYQEVSDVNPAYLGRPEAPRSYAIRSFRSDVSVMQVVTNVSAPASVVPMELVSNHLWRVRMPLQGVTNLSWTFVGTNGYVNDAAAFDTNVWVWGATNTASTVLPIINEIAVRDSAINIVITGLPDGLLTIEMNGTNGTNGLYSVMTEPYVTPVILSPASGTGLTNGAPVTVEVQLATNGAAVVTGSVVLYYAWNGGSVITQAMQVVTGTLYRATLLPAVSNLSYSVAWQYTLNGSTNTTSSKSSETFNTVSSTLLDYMRYADFEVTNAVAMDYAWRQTPGTTNWIYTIGTNSWTANQCRMPIPTVNNCPPGGTNRVIQLLSKQGGASYVQTPILAEGVGTIYYTSVMSDAGFSAQMIIQVTTNSSPGNWQDVWTNNYNYNPPAWPTANVKTTNAIPVVLNNRAVRYVRFWRTDNGARSTDGLPPNLPTQGSIYIDNIYVSRPPTGVTLGENLYNPGYPAQDQEVTVRCQVTDVDTNVPSINRQVKVWYNWESESEPFVRQTNMVETTPGVYEGVIPRHNAGTMYYWFQCDFDGYFYSRDPDGAAGVQTTRNEKDGRSPASLKEKGDDAYRNYEIRRYRSSIYAMQGLSTNAPSASIASMDLVGDHVWQGLTLVSGITNLLWTFVGTNGYVDNAAAFDTNAWVWGDNDQEFYYPPVAGYAERNATNSIKAELVYAGTLLIRMNETNGEYIVKRAVYQNFNVWPASQTDFEKSFGLYAIQTYRQDFNTNLWGYGYDAYSPNRYDLEPVDTTPVTDFVRSSPTLTWFFWAYDYARVVKERNVLSAARNAIELDAHGWVRNTAYAIKMLGTENLEFKARLSMNDPLNDRHFTYFMGTGEVNPFMASTNWPKGYWVETQFRAAPPLSPGLASCSVLTWFTPGLWTDSGEPNYYETRLTQVDPTSGGVNQLQLALYRWKDGVGALVGSPQTVTGGQSSENDLTTLKALRVQMPASGNIITARVGRVDGETDTNIWYYTAAFNDSTPLTDIGTVGFGSYDAQPEISSIGVFAGTNRVNLLPGDNWDGRLNSTNWSMGGKRISTDGAFRWRISGDSLVRDIPSQTLALYTTPVGNNTGQPDDFRVKRNITNLVVSSFDYTSFVVPLKVWDAHFVEIQNTATGEVNAVVDDLSLSPWRAVTRSDTATIMQEAEVGNVLYYKWTSESQQVSWMNLIANKACWLIMEGWMNTSPGANKAGEAQFIRNRANSNLVQALVSPYLNNNIGSIAFDWRANGVSNVVFAIDRTYGEPPNANWAASPVLIVTNNALSGTVNLPIRGELLPGRLRIRICEGTAPNAEFKIDNLIVRDYPEKDVNTTWEAYNALITEAQTSRAYEPTQPGAQTAFLNNHPTNGVAQPGRLGEHQPYIQTPKVGTGIGEITFWYRVWDTNSSAVISLQVAKDEGGPWKSLTNIVVASTDTNYLFFSNDTIYEPEYTILRIYGSTNAPYNRVCLDNVLMAESVRPSYVIQTVSLLPAQPLVGEGAGLKVDIGYFIMNPTNIRVYASTFIGTNTWGYTNWWSTAYTKIELTNSPGAPRVFQTPTNVFLPNTATTAVDDVVQFFVWGDYGGIDTNHPIVLGTNAFVNPTWYFPADLNAVTPYQESGLPALGSLGWSPYYYVYSCPPGSVWVNELRYDPDGSAPNTEFIEIVGPAGAALGRWTLQMVGYNNEVMKTSVITNGFVLKPATNGWGFLLWGDPAMSIYGNDVLFDGWSDVDPDMLSDGGVRLMRSNGAWEDRVAWGFSADMANTYGYPYAGSGPALSLRSASTNCNWPKAGDFIWGTRDPTPYASNTDQNLLVSSEYPIIASIIYSAIGPHGVHSLGPNVVESVAIAPGGSTNIIYTANEWYRIGTMQTNGVTVGAALGAKVYTLVNVQSSISNQVTFTNASSAQTGLTNRVEIHWVTNYYPTSEAAAVANTNIVRDYLLNISPTNNHTIAFSIDSIIASNKVTVTVKLADGGNALTNRINGVLRLYGKPTLNASNWSVIADATVSNASFNASGKYTLPPVSTSTNTFFKANIE